MAAAFITLTTPRSMAAEQATAWLELRAGQLRHTNAVEEVTVRELRPRQRDPLRLVHVVLGSDRSGDWERVLGDLVTDLRRLGMQPTVVIDERTRDGATITRSELQPVA
jgi:hypothetical protein